MNRVVVVGGGLVAATLARQLRRLGYDGALTVVSDEPETPYDRPPLSKQMLTGALSPATTCLLTPAEIDELGLELLLGSAATSLDTGSRWITLADGSTVRYDRLVVATGARARRLASVPALAGVHYLRSLADSQAIADALPRVRRLVVLGAGFIGLEVAAVARSRGIDVTVVEAAARPLTRVLGPDAGSIVTDLHKAHGVRFHCSATVTEVRGAERVEGVLLNGGVFLSADLLLVGVGASPNTEWLAGSGVLVDDGVVCDESGRTSVPGVFAAGDVGRWRSARTGSYTRVEQWQCAVEQARVVAEVLVGRDRVWDSVPYFWSDQYDCKLQFCGVAGPVTERRETARGPVVCFGDALPQAGSPVALVGVLTVDNPRALAQGRRLVAAEASWSAAKEWVESL